MGSRRKCLAPSCSAVSLKLHPRVIQRSKATAFECHPSTVSCPAHLCPMFLCTPQDILALALNSDLSPALLSAPTLVAHHIRARRDLAFHLLHHPGHAATPVDRSHPGHRPGYRSRAGHLHVLRASRGRHYASTPQVCLCTTYCNDALEVLACFFCFFFGAFRASRGRYRASTLYHSEGRTPVAPVD